MKALIAIVVVLAISIAAAGCSEDPRYERATSCIDNAKSSDGLDTCVRHYKKQVFGP